MTKLLFEPERLNADGWTDWIKPLPGYVLQCCACGSAHELDFAIEDGSVVYRARPFDGPENPAIPTTSQPEIAA